MPIMYKLYSRTYTVELIALKIIGSLDFSLLPIIGLTENNL